MGFYQRQVQPRMLDVFMGTKTLDEIRARVCVGLTGDVLEIGHGSGRNLRHLPREVTGVWAVEPSTVGLRLSMKRRSTSAPPVVIGGDDAQSLPFPDDRFDAALSTWTLCGIPDAGTALSEIARVLKPGAVLHFVEHGLSPDAKVARWQRRGNRLNTIVAGCVLDKDIVSLMDASGLTVTALDTYYEKGAPKASGHLFEGRAVA